MRALAIFNMQNVSLFFSILQKDDKITCLSEATTEIVIEHSTKFTIVIVKTILSFPFLFDLELYNYRVRREYAEQVQSCVRHGSLLVKNILNFRFQMLSNS